MPTKDVDKELSSLKEDLAAVRSDFSRLAEALIGEGKSRTAEARDGVEDELEAVLQRLRKQGGKTVAGIEHEIEQRPFTVILGAFVVGLLSGRLFAGR